MNKSKIIKVFIFAILVLISAFLFWQKLSQVFLKEDRDWQSLLWLAIWLLAFLTFWLFFSLLAESKEICLLIYLVALAIFFLFFKFHYYLVIGLAVIFLIFIISRALMQKERKERLKISLPRVFKKGLPLILTFLALFIALIDYFHPLIKVGQEGVNLPPQVLELVLKPLGGTISKVLPFFDPNMTIDEMLAMTSSGSQLDPSSISPELLKKFQDKDLKELNFQELLKDPEVAEMLKKQAKKVSPSIVAQQRNELAKNLGIELKGDEKIAEVINKLMNKQLQSLLGSYLKYLPIISAIFIFIVLRIIFIPFSWLVIIVSLFIFQFFLLFGVIKIEKVMKEGEDVRL